MSKPRNVWQVVACPACHDEVIRFYKADARVKYAYVSQASYAHPDHTPGSVQHDQVWVAFDVEDDLASGPEWLDLQCRCNREAGTFTTVELGRAYEAAKATTGRAVLIGEIAEQR